MSRKILFAVLLSAACGAAASAQANGRDSSRLAGSPVFSDPGFQDYIETAYGYLNPRYQARVRTDFRDSVAAPSGETRKPRSAAGKYVFVSIQPKSRNYSALVGELSASAGFVLSGERISHKRNSKSVRLLGWAPAEGVSAIRRNPGVAGLRLLRKAGRESFIRARGY